MTAGLRERKRRATMRNIQEVALDLFDERGFSHVSVEQIAAEAEVSPSTVYRYFGTKEGIILADEFDNLSEDELTELLDPDDLLGIIRTISSRFEPLAPGKPGIDAVGLRRIRYFFDEPTVRRASYEMLANAAARISRVLAAHSKLSGSEAHVASSALVFGYFAALEQWYRNPAENPVGDTLDHAVNILRGL